jgi:hypothetical protein
MASKGFVIGAATMLLGLSPSFGQNSSPAARDEHTTAGQAQPQGPTGPINTTTGGAAASSPQGETPAGMQPIPQEPSEPSRQGVPNQKKD